MPELIVLRLHPVEPTKAEDFTNYLTGLTITAKDISFSKSEGEPIGQPARYLPNDLSQSRISQNFTFKQAPLTSPPPVLHAVATAVIEVPADRVEYGFSDLHLTIERNGKKIIDRNVHYNAPTVSVPAVPEPVIPPPFGQIPDPYAIDPVGVYLALPVPGLELAPSVAYVEIPTDGSPPNFAELKEAVEKVLAKDPGGTPDLAQLTPAQCRHIAYEIVWNRQVDPPPAPSLPIEDLYTDPPPSTGSIPVDPKQAEQERKKFEAELLGYYATHNAEAERLSQYIFALSAAIYCQRQTEQAKRVEFQFPVLPTATSDTTKIQEAEVVLFNP